MRGTSAIRVFVAIALLVGPGALSTGAADPPGAVPEPPDTVAVPAGGVAVPDSSESGEPRVPRSDRVVVYYFHHTLRCETCLRFEAYTGEALCSAFPDELSDGELEWNVVNLDEPGNGHFVDDFFITENSVIVVAFRGGTQQEWANLDAIWGCVGDKPTFLSFIRNEVKARLDEVFKPVPAPGTVRDNVAPSDDMPVRR